MAAENPAAVSGTEGGEASPPPKSGGVKSFLPLIIAVIAMPLVAYVTLEVKTRMDKKAAGAGAAAPAAAEEKHESAGAPAAGHGGGSSHGGSAHGASSGKASKSAKTEGRNASLAVPLTRQLIKYQPALGAEDFDKIVTLDVKGELKDIAESDKIVVNIANTQGTRYAVGRFSVLGDHPELITRMNEQRHKLIAAVRGTLESETLEDFQRPGFKSLLSSALVSQFNAILGPGSVKEVIIEELVIQ